MRHSKRLPWAAGPTTPEKVYITRVMNFGTWEEWCALKRRFSRAEIKAALIRKPLRGQWTPKGRRLAEVLFDCVLPNDALISYDCSPSR